MTRLRRGVYSLALTAVLLLSGCRREEAAGVRLRFWAMGREGELVQRLLPEFERANPGIRVDVQQIPWSAAHEKLLTAFVGGSMPDLFQVGTTWIPEFVALGALAPLDDRLAADPDAAADVFPGILDASRVGGHTWALPWYVDTRILFYRSDTLRAAGHAIPPTDWNGWLEALTRLRAAAGPNRYALLLPVSDWQPPVILGMQRGARLLRGDDEWGDFRAPAFRQAFELYLKFFREGLAPVAAEGQITNIYQDFADGFFSVYITGPWNLGEFAARLPARLQDAWATAPMPAVQAGEAGISIAGGASLAIHAGSPHAEAAWKLAAYLGTPQRQLEFYRLSGDLPARRSAWSAGGLAEAPHVAGFWTQLQHVVAPPKVPEWERIAAKVSQYAEAAVRGQLDADAALTALDADVDRILAKRRWLLERRRSGIEAP